MITAAMKQRLRQLGYTSEQISELKSAQAHEILSSMRSDDDIPFRRGGGVKKSRKQAKKSPPAWWRRKVFIRDFKKDFVWTPDRKSLFQRQPDGRYVQLGFTGREVPHGGIMMRETMTGHWVPKPSAEAIEHLRRHPKTHRHFDAAFGPGAAIHAL